MQGQDEKAFVERMYIYNYRLFDRYRRSVVSLAALGDTIPGWRPDRFGYRRWGCEVSIRFPTAKLLDYRAHWTELTRHANPFAVIVQAHLKAQEMPGDERGPLPRQAATHQKLV